MVIGIFGESCTGKSTLAENIAAALNCEVFTGKDYLRLAKNENIAKTMFQKKLNAAVSGENIIYVISEKEHLPLLPEGAMRILATADLELIKSRFAQRMHGCFDDVPHDIHVVSGETDNDAIVEQIKSKLG